MRLFITGDDSPIERGEVELLFKDSLFNLFPLIEEIIVLRIDTVERSALRWASKLRIPCQGYKKIDDAILRADHGLYVGTHGAQLPEVIERLRANGSKVFTAFSGASLIKAA